MVRYQCSAMRGGSDHDCSSLSYRVDSPPSKRNLRDRVLFGIIAAAGLRAAEALGIYVTDLVLARTMNTSPSAAKAARSAYMPQEDLLFPWRSVLDNVTLGLEVPGVHQTDARRRARELFPVVGLAGFEQARSPPWSRSCTRNRTGRWWNWRRRLRGDGASRGQGTAATSANGSALGRSVRPVAAPTAGLPSCS